MKHDELMKLIEKLPLGEKIDDRPKDAFTEILGDNLELTGITYYLRGTKCQIGVTITSKNFLADEDCGIEDEGEKQ